MIFFYSCFEHYVLIRFLFLKVISHDEKTEFKEKAEYLVSCFRYGFNSRTSVSVFAKV